MSYAEPHLIGVAEKNMAKMFQDAANEGAVLLLDEADTFLQDRKGAQRSWEISAVNEMLTQMESFEGIFIASTNLMSSLDEAALRRFDLKMRFDYLKDGRHDYSNFMLLGAFRFYHPCRYLVTHH